MEKITFDLFKFEDKDWKECYLRAVQGFSSTHVHNGAGVAGRAAFVADQFIIDLRSRMPAKDQPEIGS